MPKSRLEKAVLLLVVIAPLVGTVVAMALLWQRLVTWRDVAIFAGMYLVTGLSITIGYHRMLTHRSFEAHPVVRFIFLMLGSMAVEGPAVTWASNHIKHHATTDTDEDPHSPLQGFFHAHMGWFITGNRAEREIYGRWLVKDRLVVFVSRTFFVWTV